MHTKSANSVPNVPPRPTRPSARDPIQDIPKYFKIFESYIGRRMYTVFALTLLGSVLEGVGIVMLLPLLGLLDGSPVTGADGTSALTNGMARIGLNTPVTVLAAIGGLFALKGAVVYAATAYSGRLQAQLMRELTTKMLDAFMTMDYLYYVRQSTGHFVNIINTQIGYLIGAFSAIVQFFAGIITTAAYFALAIMIAWRFGLLAMALGVVLLGVFRWMNIRVRELSRKNAEEGGRLSAMFIQALHGFKYLVATNEVRNIRAGALASVDKVTSYSLRMSNARALTAATREPIAVLLIIGILIVQLFLLKQTLAPIMVSILLFYRGINAVLGIQSSWQIALGQIGSLELVDNEFKRLEANREADGHVEIGPLKSEIRFNDVSFEYTPNGNQVLKNVTLVLTARQTCAIVGESGAGKSTLIDMLSLLIRPSAGEIYIDGVEQSQIRLSSWRSQIGYVSQETVMFDDSLANNICLWAGSARDDEALTERIRLAAHRAHILEFIDSLPEGLETQVGDRGVRLSGGQRQRIFIARELFKNPTLLILDEATSALDGESESKIQASIDALRGQLTVVIIAHRLATIRNVDKVFVLEQGRLLEEGAYQDLCLAHESRFAAMVTAQRL